MSAFDKRLTARSIDGGMDHTYDAEDREREDTGVSQMRRYRAPDFRMYTSRKGMSFAQEMIMGRD